jgi:hypothetical protein
MRSSEPQSETTRRSYAVEGSGSVRKRSTPGRKSYSGGTGSVQSGVPLPPRASTIRTIASDAPSVSASGFS